MNNIYRVTTLALSIILMFGTQSAYAEHKDHRKNQSSYKRWQTKSEHRNRRDDHKYRRFQSPPPPPTYRPYNHYYKPGYNVHPLPYGYSRILVDAMEYFFFDGFFYRPGRTGYVVVDAPIGAIIATLPRLHHVFDWHGRTYYRAGNTFYQRHKKGYRVVPDPYKTPYRR